jgi:hypothetical protein
MREEQKRPGRAALTLHFCDEGKPPAFVICAGVVSLREVDVRTPQLCAFRLERASSPLAFTGKDSRLALPQ